MYCASSQKLTLNETTRKKHNIKQYSFARDIKTKRSLIYVSLIAQNTSEWARWKNAFSNEREKKQHAQRGMKKKKHRTVQLTHSRECREKKNPNFLIHTRNCLQTHAHIPNVCTHLIACAHTCKPNKREQKLISIYSRLAVFLNKCF